MKHVLLVTLFDDNYGNRLQNYALQTIIINQGFEVTNAIQSRPTASNFGLRIIKNLAVDFFAFFGIERYKKKYNRRIIAKTRSESFYNFNNQYIKNKLPIGYNDYTALNLNKFDYAVTGSDQVWHNWDHVDGELDYFYLQFIDGTKRISYAASFGFSSFPEMDKEIHIRGLRGINKLSVREQTGAQLIKEYIDREAELVLDPTMLLKSTDWEKIIKKPNEVLPEKYMFLYFLGERTSSVVTEYKRICEVNNLQLVDVYNKDSAYYSMGPLEFVWMLRNADYVCTDSFHATVFSIIFHKDFKVFKRAGEGYEDMFNRIENLLNIFDLTDRVFMNNNDTKATHSQSLIDWEKIEDKLNSKRRDSIGFLSDALNG